MNVLIIIVTGHGLSSAAGGRESTALDKLMNKSRLHLKGTEFGLRLSTSVSIWQIGDIPQWVWNVIS